MPGELRAPSSIFFSDLGSFFLVFCFLFLVFSFFFVFLFFLCFFVFVFGFHGFLLITNLWCLKVTLLAISRPSGGFGIFLGFLSNVFVWVPLGQYVDPPSPSREVPVQVLLFGSLRLAILGNPAAFIFAGMSFSAKT